MALPNPYFKGKINGKNAYNYTSKLDYKLDTYEKRLELVEKILKNDDFFVEYFDNYHKVNVNKEDFLSGDKNVCNSLEKIADYLLFSSDIRENDKVNYIFYTDEYLSEKIEKEKSIEGIAEQVATVKNENGTSNFDNSKFQETIMFLVDKGKNFRKEAKQIIIDSDYLDPDLNSVIKYYIIEDNETLKILKSNNKKLFLKLNLEDKMIFKYEENINLLKEYQNTIDFYSSPRLDSTDEFKQKKNIINLMSKIKYDAILLKDKIKGTIYYNHCLPESTCTDWWLCNFNDLSHIIELLGVPHKNLLTGLGIIVYDLEQLIKQSNLNDFEKDVLQLWREEDLKQEDIAEELGVSQSYVSDTLRNICKKAIKQYKENYEDWLYLNYLKGEYKKCSQCGEIKLIDKFGKWSYSNDGYRPECKICRKE